MAPGRPTRAQMIDELLHEKERRARIDRVKPLPKREVRVGDGAAIGQTRGVDERVDVVEALQRGVEDASGAAVARGPPPRKRRPRRPRSTAFAAYAPFRRRGRQSTTPFGALRGRAFRDRQADALGRRR